jgi:hypothetical protein
MHVVVIPGFLASDRTTARLRRSLDGAGFRAHGWGLGRNGGVSADLYSSRSTDSLTSAASTIRLLWSAGAWAA